MAKIINTDGTSVEVSPANGTDFSLEELQTIVGGYIEIIPLLNDRIMVVNEYGKMIGLDKNVTATKIYQHDCLALDDVIVGNALLCESNQVR